MDLDRLKTMLRRHEGLRLEVYLCTSGVRTIGYGHRLGVGEQMWTTITLEQAERLLDSDAHDAVRRAVAWLSEPIFDSLTEARQFVVCDMAYNLGNRLWQFKQFKRAIIHQDWEQAVKEMVDSLWHRQVGQRALELEEMMGDG